MIIALPSDRSAAATIPQTFSRRQLFGMFRPHGRAKTYICATRNAVAYNQNARAVLTLAIISRRALKSTPRVRIAIPAFPLRVIRRRSATNRAPAQKCGGRAPR
jgi:hypothetical protein